MKDTSYQLLEVANGKPIKLWTQGVPVETDAKQQLINTAKLPFIFKHLAVMPDVHLGKGSTIGSVIPTLGAVIPAAVGVAAGQPDKVIAILGDGSAMYTIQGLFSAREERADVSFVILNNAAYAALTGFAGEFGMNHVPGCDLSGLDFVKLAEAQGLPARRVDAVERLDEALAWSFALPGPSLLDVRIA